jgi:hypothetical protein
MPDDSMQTVVVALAPGLAVALANATPSMNTPANLADTRDPNDCPAPPDPQ